MIGTLRTRVRPRRAFTPAAQGQDAALSALEAFDLGAALVDLTLGRVAWRSPGFASHCPVEADDDVGLLESRLPGMREALAGLERPPAMRLASDAAQAAPRVRWIDGGSGRALVVEVCLARPGLAALRLRDGEDRESDQAQAVRRHLEDRERLLFTSRTLAVGEMASTLAHELNQPIGTVANVLRGLRLRLEQQGSAELGAGVQLALDQALFASRVIARIREYTQSRQPRRALLDLVSVAREALAMMDWECRRDGVVVQWSPVVGRLPVLGDEVVLQQVVSNLLRNALDAMRDNPMGRDGRVDRQLELRVRAERDMAVLTVRDNGCGVEAGREGELFVPFQSSKPNGMGIGLKICRSFVEMHQGRIWFTRNGNGARGCAFHVALPRAADDEPAPAGKEDA